MTFKSRINKIREELISLKRHITILEEEMNQLEAENDSYFQFPNYPVVPQYPNPLFPLYGQPFQYPSGCPKCGIGSDLRPYGYVCNQIDCPSKVYCGD